MLPPSSWIVAPLTNAPARLARKMHAPATSSGVPMRPSGMCALMISPCSRSVCAITCETGQLQTATGDVCKDLLLLSKGPTEENALAYKNDTRMRHIVDKGTVRTARERVARDALRAQSPSKVPAQVVQARLGGGVRVRLMCGDN